MSLWKVKFAFIHIIIDIIIKQFKHVLIVNNFAGFAQILLIAKSVMNSINMIMKQKNALLLVRLESLLLDKNLVFF